MQDWIVKEADVPELKRIAEESRRKLVEAGLLKEYLPAPLSDAVNDGNEKRLEMERLDENKKTLKNYRIKNKKHNK